MKYSINSNISVQIISINEIEKPLNADLSFNERNETVVVIYNVPKDLIDLSENNSFSSVIAKQNESENNFISIFDAHIDKHSSSMKRDGTYSDSTVTLRSTNAIIGDISFTPEVTFQHFDLKVTDGCELIGLCPYKVNKNHIDIVLKEKVNIPTKFRKKSAKTSLGTWTFFTNPDHRFNRETLTLGLDHRIHFDSKTPLGFKEFRIMFNKLIGFFEILCGELVTVNELTFDNGKYDENYRSYEFVGYTNYPLEKLRLLKGYGMDSTRFLRQAIFKVSDFKYMNIALNRWVKLIEERPLANSAYQRILLDEDVNITTANKFLAAMQLVEGYASSLSEKKDELEFEKQKSKIIEKIDSKEDKEFLTKHCNYAGENFIKRLSKFTFDSLLKLGSLSSSQFKKKHGGLINRIKDERDIYTHSSTDRTPKFDTVELADIAVTYKYLYRINVLSELGIPSELIRKRLYHSRKFVSCIEYFFKIILERPNSDLSEFDCQMWHFSQE